MSKVQNAARREYEIEGSGTKNEKPAELSRRVKFYVTDAAARFAAERAAASFAACENLADCILDKGLGSGYNIFRGELFVGVGTLSVYDEIDLERDVLDGGPLMRGWVTHFPPDYKAPSDAVLERYKARKNNFRMHLIMGMVAPDTEAMSAALRDSQGKSVFRMAVADPTAAYGLDEEQQTSLTEFCVGYEDGIFHYPTIAKYVGLEHNFCPSTDELPTYGHVIPETASDGSDENVEPIFEIKRQLPIRDEGVEGAKGVEGVESDGGRVNLEYLDYFSLS